MPDGSFVGGNLPEHLTEKELGWSYWWVNNREKVRRWSLTVFIVIDAALLIFGLWGFVDWLIVSGLGENRSIAQLTYPNYGATTAQPAQEIVIDAPQVLPSATGKYDILIPVTNPNSRHWVYLEYRLAYDGSQSPLRKGFILPGQSKYLTELGVDASQVSGAVSVKVEKREFRPVDPHEVPDYPSWAAARSNIQVQNPVFNPAQPGAAASVASSDFSLLNDTPFSFYDIDVTVLLYRADTVVAVTRTHLDRLKAKETRPIQLFWYQNLPSVNRVEAFPDINILDPDSYKPPGT